MSLDVSLYKVKYLECECGKKHEIENECLFEANITHNLNEMAAKAGIYEACWRPYRLHSEYKPSDNYVIEMEFEDSVTIKAKDIIPLLEKGYEDMKNRPKFYEKFNSTNGWGLYIHFLPWVKKYLDACKEYPDAIVKVDR